MVAPAINTGTFGVAPQDAGVASATVTVGQQLGASIGLASEHDFRQRGGVVHSGACFAGKSRALNALAEAHGYRTAFWWACAIAAGGAVVAGLLLRPGPLAARTEPESVEPSGDLNPAPTTSAAG